jgi:hypothetical protein
VSLTDSDGNELTSEPWPGTGNTVRLSHSLSAGTDYYVFTEGQSYSSGYSDSASYPYTSTAVDIVSGVSEARIILDQPNDAYGFVSVTGYIKGTATVEWPEPASVSRWETGAFETVPDGGDVDVYVETSSDGGNSWSDWQPKPIGSGTDLSSISASDRIRFRAEFKPNAASNTPRVTLLSRQWRP